MHLTKELKGMKAGLSVKNWVIGKAPEVLRNIHNAEVNVAIYDRDTLSFEAGIRELVYSGINFRAKGSVEDIIRLLESLPGSVGVKALVNDLASQLELFAQVAQAKSYRLLLATVDTNMCRKFHTDINDLRMLCTYHGPGTMWLTDENIDRKALHTIGSDDPVALDEEKIQQVETGSVVILKGAVYPKEDTRAAVHRSPAIEDGGVRRLLLRIDTNEFLNF